MFRQLSFLQNLVDREKKRTPKNEVLDFDGREVIIKRRPYKRAIGVTLQVNGKLKVSAPKSAPLRKIHDFLTANRNWIETHAQKYEELRKAYPPKRCVEGENFLLMGEELPLRFEPVDGAKVRFRKDNRSLVCGIPRDRWSEFDPATPHPWLASGLCKFYERCGREVLRLRVEKYSRQMGLFPSSLSFRSQKTRWGSCSSKGRVSLNWRLIIAPLQVIDYVVVHELAHLRYYNHSKSFWDLVSTQIADYDNWRQWLRTNQYEADFLARQSELHS